MNQPQNPQIPSIKPAAMPQQAVSKQDDSPIGLVDEVPSDSRGESKIKAFGVAQTMSGRKDFQRNPNVTKTGAIRVRSFHGRLSDQGLGFMDEQINNWLDQHPEIEVKNVTTTVGVFEGKIREPALIVNVWY